MAKYEEVLSGDFEKILKTIEEGIVNGSLTASLEHTSDFVSEHSRCSVRIFERYSHSGGNRVSLSVTLFQDENAVIYLSACATGGSTAKFFKINTVGEEMFLDKLMEIVRSM